MAVDDSQIHKNPQKIGLDKSNAAGSVVLFRETEAKI
jgi:hypothetical protein